MPERFVCSECGETFKRLEHVERHKLSHTVEKAFACPTCGKSFTRRDTLTRHMPIHDHKDDEHGLSLRSGVDRVSRACGSCAKLRLRCDGEQPCSRCTSRDRECVYRPGIRKRIRPIISGPDSQNSVSDKNPAIPTDTIIIPTLPQPGAASKSSPHMMSGVQPGHNHDAAAKEDFSALDALRVAMSSTTGPEIRPPTRAHASSNNGEVPTLDSYQQPGHSPQVYEQQMLGENIMNAPSTTCPDYESYNQSSPWTPSASLRTHRLGDDWMTPSHQSLSLTESGESGMVGNPFHGEEHRQALNAPWEQSFDLTDWMAVDTSHMRDVDFDMLNNPQPLIAPSPFATRPSGTVLTPTSDWCLPSNDNRLGDLSSQPYPKETQPTLPDCSETQNRGRQENHSYEHSASKNERMSHATSSESARLPSPGRSTKQWPTDWDPSHIDNLVSFPDIKAVSIDFYEAEDFAHVPRLDQNTYDSLAHCVLQTNSEQSCFRPMLNAVLPPRRAMDCFVQLYFEYFQPDFPLLHEPTFDPSTTSRVLVLAVAAVGCRYSKIPDSGKCANALQELARRAIMLACERDNSNVRTTWLTQSILLNCMGMSYSGNRRLLEIAMASRSASVTQCRRNGSMTLSSHPVVLDELTEDQVVDSRWRAWIYEEELRRLGFCAWIYDTQFPLYFDNIPSMRLSEMRQQLPCKEALWNASNCMTWKRKFLQNQPDQPIFLQQVLQNLAQRRPLPYNLGDFAKLIVVHSLYRNIWDMHQYTSIPFSPRVDFDSKVEFNTLILDSLAAIKPTSHESQYIQLPLHFSLETHINIVALLCTPSADLFLFARLQQSNQSSHEAVLSLTAWMQELNGKTARRAVMHASILFGLVRAKFGRSSSPHEPIAFLIATLTIWTFARFAKPRISLGSNGNVSSAVSNSSVGEARPATIRLDRIRGEEDAKVWIENGEEYRGYLVDVGNVNASDASNRLLVVARKTLLNMETWALAQAFASVLSSLQSESEAIRGWENEVEDGGTLFC